MAGLPPLLGFIAKESALEGLLGVIGGETTAPFTPLAAWGLLIGIGVGSGLTLAYAGRFWWGTVGGLKSEKTKDDAAPYRKAVAPTASRPPPALTSGPGVRL